MGQDSISCVVMRGGTSKGLYFHRRDLPEDVSRRDRILLRAMGSPDPRQIDGMGGSHPLTSKVAVVSPATGDDADVDYLFLQVVPDKAQVRDNQTCGNILAGVGPFAIEQDLVAAFGDTTDVRIHMVNSGSIAVATIMTPGGTVTYEGDARIDGVPGTAAPVMLRFEDVAGATCGALYPTGNTSDVIDGIDVTCIDNGMPVVLMRASDLGLGGNESPAELDGDAQLKTTVESIRLRAGRLMTLGDVSDKTVPKMCLVSPARAGGAIATRTFIPHRVHEAIGVLGAVSVAAACVTPGTVARSLYDHAPRQGRLNLDIEHPTGYLTVQVDIDEASDRIRSSALLRTARKLMQGEVFVDRLDGD